jgi:hypothetical protein
MAEPTPPPDPPLFHGVQLPPDYDVSDDWSARHPPTPPLTAIPPFDRGAMRVVIARTTATGEHREYLIEPSRLAFRADDDDEQPQWYLEATNPTNGRMMTLPMAGLFPGVWKTVEDASGAKS